MAGRDFRLLLFCNLVRVNRPVVELKVHAGLIHSAAARGAGIIIDADTPPPAVISVAPAVLIEKDAPEPVMSALEKN